jgi:hypothetical protein
VLISAASAADPRKFRPTSVFSPGRSVDRGSSLLTHDSLSSPFYSFHSDQFGDDTETTFADDNEQEVVLTILDQTRQGKFVCFICWVEGHLMNQCPNIEQRKRDAFIANRKAWLEQKRNRTEHSTGPRSESLTGPSSARSFPSPIGTRGARRKTV